MKILSTWKFFEETASPMVFKYFLIINHYYFPQKSAYSANGFLHLVLSWIIHELDHCVKKYIDNELNYILKWPKLLKWIQPIQLYF